MKTEPKVYEHDSAIYVGIAYIHLSKVLSAAVMFRSPELQLDYSAAISG
jgi:hypothetical protein